MSNLPLYIYEQEEWNQMLLLYDSAIKEISTKLEILNNEFKLSHQYNPIEHLSSRLKSPESIARKLRRRERESIRREKRSGDEIESSKGAKCKIE